MVSHGISGEEEKIRIREEYSMLQKENELVLEAFKMAYKKKEYHYAWLDYNTKEMIVGNKQPDDVYIKEADRNNMPVEYIGANPDGTISLCQAKEEIKFGARWGVRGYSCHYNYKPSLEALKGMYAIRGKVGRKSQTGEKYSQMPLFGNISQTAIRQKLRDIERITGRSIDIAEQYGKIRFFEHYKWDPIVYPRTIFMSQAQAEKMMRPEVWKLTEKEKEAIKQKQTLPEIQRLSLREQELIEDRRKRGEKLPDWMIRDYNLKPETDKFQQQLKLFGYTFAKARRRR